MRISSDEKPSRLRERRSFGRSEKACLDEPRESFVFGKREKSNRARKTIIECKRKKKKKKKRNEKIDKKKTKKKKKRKILSAEW